MKNNFKLTVLVMILVLLIGISVVLFCFKIYDYLIVLGAIIIVLIVSIILEIKKSNMDDNKKYIYLLNRILKIYNPVLVETKNFPNIRNKSVLKVKNMDDLINAQYEIKKPVYYIKSDDSTVFYLLDNDVILVYFIKMYDDVSTSLEIKLDSLDSLSKGKVVNDLEII